MLSRSGPGFFYRSLYCLYGKDSFVLGLRLRPGKTGVGGSYRVTVLGKQSQGQFSESNCGGVSFVNCRFIGLPYLSGGIGEMGV